MKLEVINRTPTARVIFSYLATCNPISQQTNIITFKEHLKSKFNIKEDDFLKTFDDLEEAEVGHFTSAQPNVFIWDYNLKEVAEAITYPNRKITPEPNDREPRRTIVPQVPLTTTLKDALTARGSKEPVLKTAEIPAETSALPKETPMTPVKKRGRPFGAKTKNRSVPKEIVKVEKEVMMALRTKSGRLITIAMDDVDDLIKQVEQIKSELRP